MKGRIRIAILIVMLAVIFLCRDFSATAYEIEKYVTCKRILFATKGYQKYEGAEDGAEIIFTEADEDFAPTVKRAADLYFPLMKKDFGLEKAKPPIIVIYPGEEELQKAVGHREQGSPLGVYRGGIINVLSPRLWAGELEAEIKDKFLKEGPVVHEIAHYLFDIKTGGNFELWLAEGVALFYEYKYTGTEWRADLKNNVAALTLAQMSRDFNGLDQTVAYRYSFELVNNIVRQKGEAYLQEILSGLGDGGTIEETVARLEHRGTVMY